MIDPETGEYVGPPIPRDIAELLGIPLDDPDVEQPSSTHQEG